jgi:hypothetical protein
LLVIFVPAPLRWSYATGEKRSVVPVNTCVREQPGYMHFLPSRASGARRCADLTIKPWQFGGKTDLDNLVLVCPFHHRLPAGDLGSAGHRDLHLPPSGERARARPGPFASVA